MAVIRRIGMPENDSERRGYSAALERDCPMTTSSFHNFELTTGRGQPVPRIIWRCWPRMPCITSRSRATRGKFAEMSQQWVLGNGSVYPSPIPLANKRDQGAGQQACAMYSRRLDEGVRRHPHPADR